MMKPWLNGLVLVAAMALLGASSGPVRLAEAAQPPQSFEQQGDSPRVIRFVKNPAPVPAFSVRDFEGHTIKAADWQGKVVILNFWASWCGPCREEIPELIALAAEYGNSLQVIGLSLDEAPEESVKNFAQRMGINYPVAMAGPELQAKFGGIPALPTSFLLNREGGIVQKHVGVFPREYYDTEIRALLNLAVNAKIETFEDLGQVFLANAAHATELPGVDFSALTPEQKRVALKQMNMTQCTCGCKYTLAQCRINDPGCPVSVKMGKEIVAKITGGSPAKATPPAPAETKQNQ